MRTCHEVVYSLSIKKGKLHKTKYIHREDLEGGKEIINGNEYQRIFHIYGTETHRSPLRILDSEYLTVMNGRIVCCEADIVVALPILRDYHWNLKKEFEKKADNHTEAVCAINDELLEMKDG